MKLLSILLLVLVATGCTDKNVRPVVKEKIEVNNLTITHPGRPLPVQEVDIRWQVIVVDGDPYVSLPYEDSLDFRKFLEDMKRYIQAQQSMLCYYRKLLKEPMCRIKKDADTSRDK